jgi:hypothetical protein
MCGLNDLQMSRVGNLKVLVSAFQCKSDGVSESYSSFKWVEQIARYHQTTLLTVDSPTVPANVTLCRPSGRFKFANSIARQLNGEVKLDYFWFNRRSYRLFARRIQEFDLVHHVAPIAPRYPNKLGRIGRRFILGPIGGCQRVPLAFRKEVESTEPLYFRLRFFDRLRLRCDLALRSTFDAADCILLVGRYMLPIIPRCYHHKCEFMLETGITSGEFQSSPLPNSEEPKRPLCGARSAL